MSKPLRISDEASEELSEAVRWYETRRPGLGADFFDAILHTLDRIQQEPETGTAVFGDSLTRHLLVSRFPYHVVYRVRPDEIVIVAIAHLKRRPGYWRYRS